MNLAEALEPLSLDDFRAEYFGRKPFALLRDDARFSSLLSITELEARLNDACGSAMDLLVIGEDGLKLPRETVYQRQRAGAWSTEFLRKGELRRLLLEGKSFVMHNMSHLTPAIGAFVASIEREFPRHQCDLHVYVSPTGRSTAYNVHRDFPQHKVYLQLHGVTRWTVYRGTCEARSLSINQAERLLEVDFEAEVTPGSVIYLPPNVFHRAVNEGPRVSLSFPFHEHVSTLPVDRTHIPLREMLERDR